MSVLPFVRYGKLARWAPFAPRGTYLSRFYLPKKGPAKRVSTASFDAIGKFWSQGRNWCCRLLLAEVTVSKRRNLTRSIRRFLAGRLFTYIITLSRKRVKNWKRFKITTNIRILPFILLETIALHTYLALFSNCWVNVWRLAPRIMCIGSITFPEN